MSTELSTTTPKFETDEHAASYDCWFRSKVQASLKSPYPNVPYDQVMVDMRALLESKSNGRGSGPRRIKPIGLLKKNQGRLIDGT